MTAVRQFIAAVWCSLLVASSLAWTAETDDGAIRLRVDRSGAAVEAPAVETDAILSGPRRGFDYDAFEARLEALWFQRKALLADGRDADAAQQSELIRAFCIEEGVRRLEGPAAALLAEAHRFAGEGHHARALDSLRLAETFDPGNPQLYLARAHVFWRSGRGQLAAAGQLITAFRFAVVRAVRDLSLFNRVALILVVAWVGAALVFAVFMLLRYQVAFRHEVEEWVEHTLNARWAGPVAWAALLLPLVVWFAAGWIAAYWILITFRFMRRSEKLTAVALMLGLAAAIPAYRISVATYGMTADPIVRTTLASAGGEYDPDRIVKLRQLVEAHPQDATYRFLLAGLYKNGRYFEEAFAEYKTALQLNPALEQAYVNVGNIFHATGQHPEAIAYYRQALTVNPRSVIALFNMHLAQSEAFRFKEAEESLNEARAIDSKALAKLFAAARERGDRPSVLDAELHIASVWEAALGGGRFAVGSGVERLVAHQEFLRQLANPISVVSLITLACCGLMALATRRHAPAARCIRCGRPFCRFCKTGRESREYCSQCHHLFVLGDGLAPETKHRKVYEVERHERLKRRARSLAALVLPGASQLLRGRPGTGVLLSLLWVAAVVAWQPLVLWPVESLGGLELGLSLVQPRHVPELYEINPAGVFALLAAAAVWMAGNAWRLRRRGV